jgi:K+-sensing histidine kinase KdpD
MVMRDITHLRNLDELKMRMLTEAAGRIRIPLAQAVSNLAELGDPTKRDDEQYSATIYQLAKLLGRIQTWMDELLALVRIEAGIGYQQAEVNLTEILNSELKTQFEEARRDSDLNLEIQLEDDLPNLRVDPVLMEKMVQGLINRAADRSQRGGKIRVSARRRRGQVWIEVMDEGIPKRSRNGGPGGDPFSLPEDDQFDGEGLGLEMVRAIVGRMGGQVWIKGQGSVGSTIAISLPEIPEESVDG